MCRQLVWYLDNEGLVKRGRRFFLKQNGHTRPLSMDAARRLAIEVALILEPHIQLSRPEVQRNINATNAIYLGELVPEMSATEKAEIGRAMSKEMDNDLSHAAEYLAMTLVNLYKVDLTEGARDFLHENYGARKEVLAELTDDGVDLVPTNGFKSIELPELNPPKREWYKALVRARKQLV